MQLSPKELSIIAAALDFYIQNKPLTKQERLKVEDVANYVVKNQEADQDEE